MLKRPKNANNSTSIGSGELHTTYQERTCTEMFSHSLVTIGTGEWAD